MSRTTYTSMLLSLTCWNGSGTLGTTLCCDKTCRYPVPLFFWEDLSVTNYVDYLMTWLHQCQTIHQKFSNLILKHHKSTCVVYYCAKITSLLWRSSMENEGSIQALHMDVSTKAQKLLSYKMNPTAVFPWHHVQQGLIARVYFFLHQSKREKMEISAHT